MDSNYGFLINPQDLMIQRQYFQEMAEAIGVKVLHRAPRPGKSYTNYGEIDTNYFEPELVACIFDEHPNPRTMKKLGWDSELETQASIISVPYDLRGLQQGSLFIVPSAYDKTKARIFRVSQITSIMIAPCSLTCQLVPEFENTFSNNSFQHRHDSFNLLNREDDED